MCSCCDNHAIFTQAKHQHMVPSVKVSLAMMKQDYFHQSESEKEWYVLLRWTIEPKQTISYSEASPHTSAQLIIAFSFRCDLDYPLTLLCILWSVSTMDTVTIKTFRELQNIAHTLFRTPWSMRHHIITSRLFLFSCCAKEFSKTNEPGSVGIDVKEDKEREGEEETNSCQRRYMYRQLISLCVGNLIPLYTHRIFIATNFPFSVNHLWIMAWKSVKGNSLSEWDWLC